MAPLVETVSVRSIDHASTVNNSSARESGSQYGARFLARWSMQGLGLFNRVY
jgi:hypothetical protein